MRINRHYVVIAVKADKKEYQEVKRTKEKECLLSLGKRSRNGKEISKKDISKSLVATGLVLAISRSFLRTVGVLLPEPSLLPGTPSCPLSSASLAVE